MTNGAQPLSGVRVLDLTRVFAGPLCTQTLADLGAEVIKIERPGKGDDTRGWGPPFLKDRDGRETSESAYYLSTNRGKRSVTLDLSQPAGQRVARALAARCDVLVENYKVGDLARYGLDYESLRAANPGLVYCSVTGYGQTGPEAHKPGYDFIFQGISGLMSITGERDDLPGGGPQKVGVAVGDALTGMHAAVGILSALMHRRATGLGQHIDVCLLDALMQLVASQSLSYLVSGRVPKRHGNGHPNVVPYDAFAAADGHIILAVGNDSQFASFCATAGRPDLAQDPRFAQNRGRVVNRAALMSELVPLMKSRSRRDWIEALEAANVPCGPINTVAEAFDEPQVQDRKLRVDIPHPLAGTVPSISNPLRLSATPVRYDTPPPLLGQHTQDILRGVLGLGDAELRELADAKVI
jgi:crotonobetainyl-CoA:carnitine CoA-transferase CaiB-like acyl-CoA transferase